MEITAIIVGGMVLVTALAGLFDFLSKKRTGKDPALYERLDALERRQKSLESQVEEKDIRIAELEREIGFVNRMLEHKVDGKGGTAAV
jgi:hypothetical protein